MIHRPHSPLLLLMLALASLGVPPEFPAEFSQRAPDEPMFDPEELRRGRERAAAAEAKRKRRAAKAGASDYAKRNA